MMKYSDVAALGDNVADIIAHLAGMGVVLREENGRLTYKGPKGVLDQDDIAVLRVFKNQIIALLGGHEGVSDDAALDSRSGVHVVPLAFSQLAHWHAYRLEARHSYAVIGMATRWKGDLDLAALRGAVSAMVKRHEALRTRIVVCGGMPMQEVRKSADCELAVDDLTALPDSSRNSELALAVKEYMLDPMDIRAFPLFRFQLLRVQNDEHVFVTVMEHIISDGVSIDLLNAEILSIYQDLVFGRSSSLAPTPLQFSEYARRQRGSVQSWIRLHYPYWKERLRGCQRVRFPADLCDEGRAGLSAVRFRIDRDLRAEARAWCRYAGTTHVMTFFVAFVALALRWCNVSESVILFQTDGRTGETERTFGYLASPLYLRVELFDSDSFVDLLHRVTHEYCNAVEHADSSFLEAHIPVPGFSRNTRFNWLRYEPSVVCVESLGMGQEIDVRKYELEPQPVPSFDRDIEPVMSFAETDEEIVGFLSYRVDRFSNGLMERFVRNYLRLVDALLRSPETNVKNVALE
jgi:Condensation domain/TubC N-terminal docking domain